MLLSVILALLCSFKPLRMFWALCVLSPSLRYARPQLPLLLFLPWWSLQGGEKNNCGTNKWVTGDGEEVEEGLFFALWVLATLFQDIPPGNWDSQFGKHGRMTFFLPLFLCRKHMKLWQSRNSRTVKVYIPLQTSYSASSPTSPSTVTLVTTLQMHYSSIPQAQVSFSFCIWFSICLSPQIFTALTILIIHVSL